MNKVWIKNKNNIPIGWWIDNGSDIQAYHFTKGFVGRYVKGSNITFNKSGSVFSYGNTVVVLIFDAERGIS